MKIKQLEWTDASFMHGSCRSIAKINQRMYIIQNFIMTPIRNANEIYKERYDCYRDTFYFGTCNTLEQAKEVCVKHCEDYVKGYLENE